ncbi:tRNA uridine-5-carboxymethylaminomethyl(34) synthesis enzyme MnmG [[Mycoplasma] testudinis]|uniref:tRNA uridine-5-carboxymethylaminomethyl(34) synthesis enzyme MnmG n=1 Tax=[Mycoplasma] testudinis TaxID=33924 RepID=UPI00048121CF|nr:tRNA uridine-5-carboxymethylaminomethyl(34) synthesis enzyme MnmG [[Mycoplasma] testudinis]
MKKIIVVGAGHAGLEAAFSCARLKCKVFLIVLNANSVGNCPCNPSVGGPAKGIVTREIDALGGMQAKAADACRLQMKLLNSSKGPGVQALRAQIDKKQYHSWFLKKLKETKNITLIEDEVIDLIVKNKIIKGVVLKKQQDLLADAVILTTGTYLESSTHQGKSVHNEGPDGYINSQGLSHNLKKLGFKLLRLKTGTPPRIAKDSIDYSQTALEPGTPGDFAFSFSTKKFIPLKKQLPCYLIHTNKKTHDIILENISASAVYGGQIKGVGPRYCPSIEDKVMRFSDKPRHQIFLEPESLDLNTIYLGGFSTSFEVAIQDKIIRTLPGLKNCKVVKYGYAIQYDAIDPIQLFPTLETKLVKNLYSAGQINGTSGYEEAAGQGLMAGINAVLKLNKKKPLILKRDEAYIGVMIDDIVTKGVSDPYRLLTSRAEHRLLLRNDNAQQRLIKHAKRIGMISKKVYDDFLKSEILIKKVIKFLKDKKIGQYLPLRKLTNNTNLTLHHYLSRPEVKLVDLLKLIGVHFKGLRDSQLLQIEIQVKYEGYIKNYLKNLKKIGDLSNFDLPSDCDYHLIPNLSNEAQDKLNLIKPLNLAQASRISGINFPDLVAVKNYFRNKRKPYEQ